MLAKLRARWGWLDTTLAMNERFGAVGGGPLAASIALSTFVSLFPLLLVSIAVVGFLSSGNEDFASDVVRDLGLTGQAADIVEEAIGTAEGSRQAASIIGLAGLLWSGLGVVGSLQVGLNAVWQVTGRGLLDRVVALRWLLGAGALFLISAALGPLLRVVPGPVLPLTVLLGIGVSFVLFLWTYSSLGHDGAGWRAHVPGALLMAAGFEVLKIVGAVWVPRMISSSSALYGSLGVVFAVLAWLMIYARLIVYGAALNVVRYEAEAGTVTVEVQVPRIDGEVPLTATRGGAVQERADGGT